MAVDRFRRLLTEKRANKVYPIEDADKLKSKVRRYCVEQLKNAVDDVL